MREKPFSTYQKAIFSHNFDYLNFGRFDAGAVLHHSNYYHLFEDLRERFLIKSGISYKSLMDEGYHLPLVESSQKFIKPVFYNQVITGLLFLDKISRTSISFNHELQNEKKETLNLTTTKHVFVSLSNGIFKPTAIPDKITNLFKE